MRIQIIDSEVVVGIGLQIQKGVGYEGRTVETNGIGILISCIVSNLEQQYLHATLYIVLVTTLAQCAAYL